METYSMSREKKKKTANKLCGREEENFKNASEEYDEKWELLVKEEIKLDKDKEYWKLPNKNAKKEYIKSKYKSKYNWTARTIEIIVEQTKEFKPKENDRITWDEEKPEFSLHMYPCLKNFFPVLKIKISKLYKKDIAEAIVSALWAQYPDLSMDPTPLEPLMDKWNDQLKASGIYKLSENRLEEAETEGSRRKPSCTRYNSIYPLRKQCTPRKCSEHDGTIKRPPDITKRLQDEITSVTVFKGDNTEMTKDLYTIHLRDNDIIFSHKQLTGPKNFIERYMQVFGDLLSITHGEWYEIVNTTIKQKITSTIDGEKVGTQEYYRELFVDHLRELGMVYSWDEFSTNSIVYDTTNSTLWVEKDQVEEIKEKIGLDCNPRKLRMILNPIIDRNVERKRTGGNRYYFWIFNAKKIGIKPSIDKLDSYIEKQEE